METLTPPKSCSEFLTSLRQSHDSLSEDFARDEILSVEGLEQYALFLASELRIEVKPTRGKSLLPSLSEVGDKLLKSYLQLSGAIKNKENVFHAAEWYVDNFHIVEDQLREIKRDLPKNYYDELPKLVAGELVGFPRVYAIALAIIAHTDSRLDADALKRFFISFQKQGALKIGELWAVPITLRIALLEHLAPLTQQIARARQMREEANLLADRILESGAKPDTLIEILAAELKSRKKLDRAFAVQLVQRLRDQDPDVWPAFEWLEKQLESHQTNTVRVMQLEHFRQATAQVTIGNIITSMRLLSSLDWRVFFESISEVDRILSADTNGTYSKMDFATRDQYRHSIERIAKRSNFSEIDIAKRAVSLTKEVSASASDQLRKTHVGYYLVGDGLRSFESIFSYRPFFKERIIKMILRRPTFFYLGSIAALTLLLMIPVVDQFESASLLTSFGIFFFCLLAFFPATESALYFFNYLITSLIAPKLLPKIDLEKSVPDDSKTMVVIPTLFTSKKVVEVLLEKLEVHYIGNQDSNIYFALLGDFGDADEQTKPSDDVLLEIAQQGIDSLNFRYCKHNENKFYLFHRVRKWNASEGKWIGWERKRGKILEFNQLLRGSTGTTYLPHKAKPELLQSIKYVITLDSDTQLVRDSAKRLIGTIVHPLNQPYYCPEKNRVTHGYGILQPRISVSVESASRSYFAKIFSGNTGLDPYTTAVSDVYQDLFGEGSFTGKGLYAVDAFELAVAHRGPENAVLSHDLFEGSYARSALVTDVELLDDYPSDFDSYAKRQHRWTRGDWQIAQWLFPKVPDAHGQSVSNNLPLISRWKIFDNLRRSLVVPATLLWLILAWTLLPGSAFFWTIPIILLFTFSVYAPLIKSLMASILTIPKLNNQGLPLRERIRSATIDTAIKLEQIILMVAFLPSLAVTQTDAIFRAVYRQLVSK